MKPHVKFLLEELGAALGIAQILSRVAVGFDLHTDGTLLKGNSKAGDTLAV